LSGPFGIRISALTTLIFFAVKPSAISVFVTEPKSFPSTPAFCVTARLKPARALALSLAASRSAACCFSSSARLASNSALFESVARLAFPCGIKKFLPNPSLTLTMSPRFPKLATFSNKITCIL